MTTAFVVGYDPGGKDAHGVAVLEVCKESARWNLISLQVAAGRALRYTVAWLEQACRNGCIVAAGIDTLTDWNSGHVPPAFSFSR